MPQRGERAQRIAAGDVITIGGRDWRVLIGKGHAPEHVSLYCAETDTLIAGDQVLPQISPNVSVDPAQPESDPLAGFLQALDNPSHPVSDVQPLTGRAERLRIRARQGQELL